jgi:hypothetical protein
MYSSQSVFWMIWSGLKGYLVRQGGGARERKWACERKHGRALGAHSATLQASRESSARRMLRSDDVAARRACAALRQPAAQGKRVRTHLKRTDAGGKVGREHDALLLGHLQQQVADLRVRGRRHAHGQRARAHCVQHARDVVAQQHQPTRPYATHDMRSALRARNARSRSAPEYFSMVRRSACCASFDSLSTSFSTSTADTPPCQQTHCPHGAASCAPAHAPL